jgi:hypothetical protein
LSLEYNKITDINALEVNNFPLLQTLVLCHNLISDLSIFERMDYQKSKLSNLYLDDNKIDKEKNSSTINKLRRKIKSFSI